MFHKENIVVESIKMRKNCFLYFHVSLSHAAIIPIAEVIIKIGYSIKLYRTFTNTFEASAPPKNTKGIIALK